MRAYRVWKFCSALALAATLALGAVATSRAAPVRFIPIEQAAASLDAELSNLANGYVMLRAPHVTAILVPDVRRAEVGGIGVYMNAAFVRDSRGGRLTEIDFDTALLPLFQEGTELPWPIDPLVVIDPGHGGADPGATARGLVEKDAVLDIACRLQSALNRSGLRTRLTREDDRTLTLDQRAQLTRQWDAALFISIHLNSSNNRDANGAETYVMPANGFPSTSNGSYGGRDFPGNRFDAENTRLGYYVQKGLITASGASDRGVRRARFEVLRQSPCPAILLECGFVTSWKDARRLREGDHRDRVAQGIASGIFTYVARRENGLIVDVLPIQPDPPPTPVPTPAPDDPPDEEQTLHGADTPAPTVPPPVPTPTVSPPPQPPPPPPPPAPVLMGPPAPLRFGPVDPSTVTNAPLLPGS